MTRDNLIEQIRILEELEKRKARDNLLSFTEYTKDDYIANAHHVVYAEYLDKFMSGDIKNLMVFMPPQTGKTELSTRRLPAKMLGDNPDLKISVAAYNNTISSKFNKEIQRIMQSEEYGELYPSSSLNKVDRRTKNTHMQNADEFEVIGHNGSLVSVGRS